MKYVWIATKETRNYEDGGSILGVFAFEEEAYRYLNEHKRFNRRGNGSLVWYEVTKYGVKNYREGDI